MFGGYGYLDGNAAAQAAHARQKASGGFERPAFGGTSGRGLLPDSGSTGAGPQKVQATRNATPTRRPSSARSRPVTAPVSAKHCQGESAVSQVSTPCRTRKTPVVVKPSTTDTTTPTRQVSHVVGPKTSRTSPSRSAVSPRASLASDRARSPSTSRAVASARGKDVAVVQKVPSGGSVAELAAAPSSRPTTSMLRKNSMSRQKPTEERPTEPRKAVAGSTTTRARSAGKCSPSAPSRPTGPGAITDAGSTGGTPASPSKNRSGRLSARQQSSVADKAARSSPAKSRSCTDLTNTRTLELEVAKSGADTKIAEPDVEQEPSSIDDSCAVAPATTEGASTSAAPRMDLPHDDAVNHVEVVTGENDPKEVCSTAEHGSTPVSDLNVLHENGKGPHVDAVALVDSCATVTAEHDVEEPERATLESGTGPHDVVADVEVGSPTEEVLPADGDGSCQDVLASVDSCAIVSTEDDVKELDLTTDGATSDGITRVGFDSTTEVASPAEDLNGVHKDDVDLVEPPPGEEQAISSTAGADTQGIVEHGDAEDPAVDPLELHSSTDDVGTATVEGKVVEDASLTREEARTQAALDSEVPDKMVAPAESHGSSDLVDALSAEHDAMEELRVITEGAGTPATQDVPVPQEDAVAPVTVESDDAEELLSNGSADLVGAMAAENDTMAELSAVTEEANTAGAPASDVPHDDAVALVGACERDVIDESSPTAMDVEATSVHETACSGAAELDASPGCEDENAVAATPIATESPDSN